MINFLEVYSKILEEIFLKTKITAFALGLLAAFSLTACGNDADEANEEIANFKTEIDAFCTAISTIDTSINTLDAEAEDASTQLLGYLDDLDGEFQDFAELDFPAEYDYLEHLADEAGDYMTEAVTHYHKAYDGDTYDENTAEYAKQNYSRAYKRIQIIISFLHGEEPEDVDVDIEYSEQE